MPSFDVEEVDIDPSEFVSACSKREIKELIQELTDEGHIKKDSPIENSGPSSPNIADSVFDDSLNILYRNRLYLSVEEEDMINKLAERFKYL
jgi:hypothetical protein